MFVAASAQSDFAYDVAQDGAGRAGASARALALPGAVPPLPPGIKDPHPASATAAANSAPILEGAKYPMLRPLSRRDGERPRNDDGVRSTSKAAVRGSPHPGSGGRRSGWNDPRMAFFAPRTGTVTPRRAAADRAG